MNFFFKRKSIRPSKGVSLVEVVVATAIFLGAVVAIHSAFTIAIKASLVNTEHLQAAFLAEEGVEAIKSIRDYGWQNGIGNKTLGVNHKLIWSTNRWDLSTTPSMIDQKFDRSIVLSAVSRDSSGNVVTSGGSNDANSRKVTVTVSWREGAATTTKSIEAYISNVFYN